MKSLRFSAITALAVAMIFQAAVSLANAADNCSLEALTNNCKMFDPKVEKITFSDGTFIRNMSYKGPKTKPSVQPSSEEIKAAQEFEYQLDTSNQQEKEIKNRIYQMVNSASKFSTRKKSIIYWYLINPQWTGFLDYDFGNPISFLDLTHEDSLETQDYEGPSLKLALQNFFGSQWDDYLKLRGQLNAKQNTNEILRLKIAELKSQKTVTRDPSLVKRLEQIFTDARKGLINLITRGRSEDQLSASEKSSIFRLNTIKYKPFNCKSGEINANYNPIDHSFTVCDGLLEAPEASLVGVVAHELFHAIDPCSLQMPLYQVNQAKLQSAIYLNQSNKSMDLVDLLRNSKYTNLDVRSYFPRSGVDLAEGMNVLELKEKGVARSNYPFNDVYSCLKSPQGGSFIEESAADRKKVIDSVILFKKQRLGDGYDAKKDREILNQKYLKYSQCGMGAHSEMTEATADWAASEVEGNYLKGQKFETPKDRLKQIAVFANIACSDRTIGIEPFNEAMPAGEIDQRITSYSPLMLDSHPAGVKRLKYIIMRNPNLAKALGCNTELLPPCTHAVGVDRGIAPFSAGTGKIGR